MPIISSSDIVADDEADLLAHIRESASCLSFHPRGTVRCQGLPLFRNQAARDLGCLLDVDPDVESWSCLPTVLAYGTGMHVPDFAVERSGGTILVDVVPPDAKLMFSRGIRGTKLFVMPLSLVMEFMRAARRSSKNPEYLEYMPSWLRVVAVDHVRLSPAYSRIMSVSPHSTGKEQKKNVLLETRAPNL
jgi:hypothetical protein